MAGIGWGFDWLRAGFDEGGEIREVNFRLFRKLLQSKPLLAITIDIDSSVVNVEGHQEGTARGYNPKKPGNPLARQD